MHPALSIIAFTSLSGAGYGLLFWLGLLALAGRLPASLAAAALASLLTLGLVTAGLSASLLHLRHPERAWRALSQWRSSWLSREGVAALATFPAAFALLGGWLAGWGAAPLALAGIASALLAAVTVFSTGMIYASLKPVPAWHTALTTACFLAFAAMSGALWLLAAATLGGVSDPALPPLAAAALFVAWGLKAAYWRRAARLDLPASRGSTVGAPGALSVRSLAPPHSEPNYLLREMGYVIARRHAEKLRRLAVLSGLLLPGLCLLLAIVLPPAFLALAAALSALLGIMIERWLFFAEARHSLSAYY